MPFFDMQSCVYQTRFTSSKEKATTMVEMDAAVALYIFMSIFHGVCLLIQSMAKTQHSDPIYHGHLLSLPAEH